MHALYPQYIQFFPTLRCNRTCNFCFNRGIRAESDISLHNFGRLVERMASIGVRELDILGGEPTLHHEFSALINLACTSGIKVSMSTNGSNVKVLEQLSELYSDSLLAVGVSINGTISNNSLHTYILKYKQLLKSISTKNYLLPEHAKKYLELEDITYYLLFMDTTYSGDLKNSMPLYEFHKRLRLIQKEYKNVEGIYCGGFIFEIEKYPFLEQVRCPAGTTKLSVMPDGSVYPCYLFFRHSEFKLGNIMKDDFSDIWENPTLNYFRHFKHNNCPRTNCELFLHCHGGCPAISLLIYDDVTAPDPRCA